MHDVQITTSSHPFMGQSLLDAFRDEFSRSGGSSRTNGRRSHVADKPDHEILRIEGPAGEALGNAVASRVSAVLPSWHGGVSYCRVAFGRVDVATEWRYGTGRATY